MSARTLFLAWQDNRSRQWFPVGRLDADPAQSKFRFRYTGGAERAQQEAGFPLAVDFPTLREDYRSAVLFPLFRNRIMAAARPDYAEYLEILDLPAHADPIEILAVEGGYRVTDAFEVFSKLEKNADGSFRCRFFLHGSRYVNTTGQERFARVTADERLHVTLELSNPVARVAVQLQTLDYHVIGWAPRYLVKDLMMAMAESPGTCVAHVARVNPLPAPSTQRLLIELAGNWGSHEPMTDTDFQPLVE
jgi:hypothetical protein